MTDEPIPATDRIPKVAAGLSLSGVMLAVLILVAACAGFDGSLLFSVLPVILGVIGLGLGLPSARTGEFSSESSTVAAVFTGLLAITAGLLEMAAWLHWSVLFSSGK